MMTGVILHVPDAPVRRLGGCARSHTTTPTELRAAPRRVAGVPEVRRGFLASIRRRGSRPERRERQTPGRRVGNLTGWG